MKILFITSRKKDLLLAFLMMLFFISFATCITVFFKQLYYFDISYLHIDRYVSLDVETIKKNYDILIQYQSLFYHGELHLPDFIMSTTGRIHFEEVKRIFVFLQILTILLPIIIIPMIIKNVKDKEYDFLKLASLFSVGIPTILGIIASANFDQAFILFHKIVFRNDFWLFDYRTDPVINILPESFFMHCFFMIVIIVVICSGICYCIYRKKRKEILG